jgi:murein DD-endopeptidase MepM/ murein hydrolase activator NlpD
VGSKNSGAGGPSGTKGDGSHQFVRSELEMNSVIKVAKEKTLQGIIADGPKNLTLHFEIAPRRDAEILGNPRKFLRIGSRTVEDGPSGWCGSTVGCSRYSSHSRSSAGLAEIPEPQRRMSRRGVTTLPLREMQIRRPVTPNTYGAAARPRGHWGWDLLAPVGTSIKAIGCGKVKWTRFSPIPPSVSGNRRVNCGWQVLLQFRSGARTLHAHYAHLSQPGHFSSDQKVKLGDVLRYTGRTGYDNFTDEEIPSHLHFEIRTTDSLNLQRGRMDARTPRLFLGRHPCTSGQIWTSVANLSGSRCYEPNCCRTATMPAVAWMFTGR